MLADTASAPFDDADWVFEVKYDGYRATALIRNGNAELYSRNLNSFTKTYPSIVKELSFIEHDVMLDGEIVAENSKGHSEFQLLQNHGNEKIDLKYYVFDLLHLNGHDLYGLTLLERKNLLKLLLEQMKFRKIIYSELVSGKGIAFYQKAIAKKLEGIIAKKATGLYHPGKRSREWLKIKIVNEEEMIIAGFTAPRGEREFFGSLLLAYYENGTLRYAGNCGTGFSQKVLEKLYNKAKPFFRSHSPFKERIQLNGKVQWIEPKLVCQVKFTEWTKEKHLRHPVYLGLREDKSAEEVVRGNSTKDNLKMGKTTTAKKKNPADLDLKVGKVTLHLTNQEKIYWPKEKYSKGDLVSYYDSVAEYILPYLKDRPESMNRFPNGINGPSFYQKDVDVAKIPSWLKTEKMFSSSNQEMIDYLVCNDKATLLYMANLGCIEMNPWNSRIQKPDNPDWLVIDLDPEDIAFSQVVKTALTVKETLDEIDVDCHIKTSGATGLHIYIPLAAKYDYRVARTFAELIAHRVHEKLPDITSVLRSPAKRKKKVYLDFLQNSRGQTLAAPYAVRPRPGATVSTPLKWNEVNSKLDPASFTIKTILKRLDKFGDLWKPVLGKGENIQKALNKFDATEENKK